MFSATARKPLRGVELNRIIFCIILCVLIYKCWLYFCWYFSHDFLWFSYDFNQIVLQGWPAFTKATSQGSPAPQPIIPTYTGSNTSGTSWCGLTAKFPSWWKPCTQTGFLGQSPNLVEHHSIWQSETSERPTATSHDIALFLPSRHWSQIAIQKREICVETFFTNVCDELSIADTLSPLVLTGSGSQPSWGQSNEAKASGVLKAERIG